MRTVELRWRSIIHFYFWIDIDPNIESNKYIELCEMLFSLEK